jgi:hypothetical protein
LGASQRAEDRRQRAEEDSEEIETTAERKEQVGQANRIEQVGQANRIEQDPIALKGLKARRCYMSALQCSQEGMSPFIFPPNLFA